MTNTVYTPSIDFNSLETIEKELKHTLPDQLTGIQEQLAGSIYSLACEVRERGERSDRLTALKYVYGSGKDFEIFLAQFVVDHFIYPTQVLAEKTIFRAYADYIEYYKRQRINLQAFEINSKTLLGLNTIRFEILMNSHGWVKSEPITTYTYEHTAWRFTPENTV